MRIKPEVNEIYHIFNRGTEKRDVFMDDKDYQRFIDSMEVFNGSGWSFNWNRSQTTNLIKTDNERVKGVQLLSERLADILAYCLMPNHFHLLLRQRAENGISQFMQRVGTGYTNYFNLRYERSGALFQGKYKFVHVTQDAHFMLLPLYIHANPVGKRIGGKSGKSHQSGKSAKELLHTLDEYPWSSHPYFSGRAATPWISSWLREEWFGGPIKYRSQLVEWLHNEQTGSISDVAIDLT